MSVYSFGITLSTFGMNLAVTRLVSEELAIGNKEGCLKISKRCIFISLICGLMASIIFFIFSDLIARFSLHDKINKNVIYIMCLAFPFISMSSAISGYFIAIRRVYKSTIAQFFEQIIKIILTAFFLKLFLPKGLEYACFSLILGDLVSEIFSFLCNYLLYINDSKIYKTSYNVHHPKKYYNKKIFKIATPVAIASFIRSGLSTLKQIIIPINFEKGMLDCAKSLSIYGKINGMAMPVIIFPNVIFSSISGLMIPEFAAYNAQKRYKKIKNLTKITLIIASIISIFISILLFLFSKQLSILVYKTDSISNYIKLLSPMTTFILLDCVTDNILKGLDAQNDVMLINIIDLFIDIIFIYLLVPKFGIVGYIISMYFSEITNLFLSMKKLFKIVLI